MNEMPRIVCFAAKTGKIGREVMQRVANPYSRKAAEVRSLHLPLSVEVPVGTGQFPTARPKPDARGPKRGPRKWCSGREWHWPELKNEVSPHAYSTGNFVQQARYFQALEG